MKAERRTAVIINISDTGPGIASEDLLQVFDRFYRADKSRQQGEGESGLGLAIVHKIVENHQGEIDVESPPSGKDRGSRFVIRIPFDKA